MYIFICIYIYMFKTAKIKYVCTMCVWCICIHMYLKSNYLVTMAHTTMCKYEYNVIPPGCCTCCRVVNANIVILHKHEPVQSRGQWRFLGFQPAQKLPAWVLLVFFETIRRIMWQPSKYSKTLDVTWVLVKKTWKKLTVEQYRAPVSSCWRRLAT